MSRVIIQRSPGGAAFPSSLLGDTSAPRTFITYDRPADLTTVLATDMWYQRLPLTSSPVTAAFTATVVNLTANFSSAGSSGPIASYAWDFGDGNTGVGANPSHAYANTGTYTVTLTVSDSSGQSVSTVQNTIQVAPPNVAPNAVFTFSASDLVVIFDGTGSFDTDGTIVSYTWDFGDGSPTSGGSKLSHTYAAAGTYQVSLQVKDNTGLIGTVVHAVTVTSGSYNYLVNPYGSYKSYKPTVGKAGLPPGTTIFDLTIEKGNGTDLVITDTSQRVFDKVRFQCRVVIKTAKPVLFTRCGFEGNTTQAKASGLIDCNSTQGTGRNVKAYDSYFKPMLPSVWWDGVVGHDYELHRCEIMHTVDGIGAFNNYSTSPAPDYANVECYGVWIHDLAYFSPDPTPSNGLPYRPNTHNDGCQWQGDKHVWLVGCNIESFFDPAIGAGGLTKATRDPVKGGGPNNPTAVASNPYGYNQNTTTTPLGSIYYCGSVMQMTNATGTCEDLLLDGCWTSGGSHMINASSQTGSYPNLGIIQNTIAIKGSNAQPSSEIAVPNTAGPAGFVLNVTLTNNLHTDGTPMTVLRA